MKINMKTNIKPCAKWCSGINHSVASPLCSVPNCEYDKRWEAGNCECESRGYKGSKECEESGQECKSEWLHNGMHLICKICGTDGTQIMKTNKHGDLITVDNLTLEMGVWETHGNEWDFVCWIRSFTAYEEVSGGRFNIWMTPTQWPRKRWSKMARDFSYKLAYRWDKYASRMRSRGLKAQKNLEHMRYYYDKV